MKSYFKTNVLPHLVAVLIFLAISLAYFSPQLTGKRLSMHDWKVWQASSKEKTDFREQTGEITNWTNSMFGGMPTYLISTPKEHNIFARIQKIMGFGFGEPATFLFYYLLGFYVLLLVFRVNPWLSVAGAIGFGFSSYFFVIITAGHLTKAAAIGFIAPIIAGVYLAYDRKMWQGMLLMTFALALQILTNHLQIVYYTALIILGLGIAWLVDAIVNKKILNFVKTTGLLLAGVALAIGINATNLLTTQEYAPYSMRGQSELTNAEHLRTTGLNKDYATGWSYGIDETFTLLVPNIKGGASYSPLSEDSETYNMLRKYYDSNARDIVKFMPTYFGLQPSTSGPVYAGAIIFFLFILSLMVVKGKFKWWLLAITVLSILLAWGKNFMWFTELFLDYFPGYNKFRTVSMILVIAEFAMPLLAFLGLREIVMQKVDPKKLMNYFYVAIGITALTLLTFIAMPGIFGNQSEHEVAFVQQQLLAGVPDDPKYDQVKQDLMSEFTTAIQNDRLDLIRADAARSLAYVVLGALIVWLLIRKKMNVMYASIALAVLLIADMWTINKRYLNEDNFVSKRNFEVPYDASVADNAILADKSPDYRVCNLSMGINGVFADASTSYFHKSIGGYHGAKMLRYQELMDSVMSSELQMTSYIVSVAYQNGLSREEMQMLFDKNARTPVLNMLNTKYIIIDPNDAPLVNKSALGAAWFVDKYSFAEDANQEILAMRKLNTADEAVVDRRYEEQLKGLTIVADSNARIEMVKYAPNRLTYESNAAGNQLAVFSEIYYSKGWQAYIDGQPKPHFRANYVLRAMVVPAGKHTIEFVFDPPSYKTGNLISYICSAIVLLLCAWFVIQYFRKLKKARPESSDKKIK
ncbi:MAG TPA: YfhO family protein [Bacteroidales bacterium]|nr:YfhO family protein [Bacteroidales bacterium]